MTKERSNGIYRLNDILVIPFYFLFNYINNKFSFFIIASTVKQMFDLSIILNREQPHTLTNSKQSYNINYILSRFRLTIESISTEIRAINIFK